MIDYDELIERKDLRKVMNRKEEVKREKTGRKRKTGVWKISIACASLRQCIRAPLRP